jgi:subtilisin family serine protease
MKRYLLSILFLFFPFSAKAAANQFIVRDTLGLLSLTQACLPIGCNVVRGLDGNLGQLFLVTAPGTIDPNLFIIILDSLPGVVDAEIDQLLHVQQSSGMDIPSGLYDSTPVAYFGATVWHGYVDQPAAQIVRVADAQNGFSATGAGIVAVIDTGIDPYHPAFANIVVSGYDFTRNSAGGSERNDVGQWDTSGQPQPAQVNQSTMGVVNPYNATTLSAPQYAAFGHGTMVAGIVHLVAPAAQIMALKAFKVDGSGRLSDVLRAVYYAVHNNAKVISMSFSFPSYSNEMEKAVEYANDQTLVCAAAAGNDGKNETVYPAGYNTQVMGVASTTDSDAASSFSNYGADVWVAAPGEAIITTYPFGTYAAGWGTSFSTPFVSGGMALLVNLRQSLNQDQAASALGAAVSTSPQLGQGRIDLYQALSV